MARKPFYVKALLAALAASLSLQPAFADVKAGVDAWTKGEFDKAVKEWRGPALNGDADAQFNLGQAYKLGRGVKTDLGVALDWYKKAAEQGHFQAADSYGQLLHYQGKVSEALPYLQSSADRGEPRSQYLLATELFNGVYLQKDWVRAYALMTRASSAGMAPASRSLVQMDKFIPLDQRQKGTVLAGEIEKNAGRIRSAQIAGFPINTAPLTPASTQITVPPSVSPDPSPVITPGFPSNVPVANSQGHIPVKPPISSPPVVQPAIVKTAQVKVATTGNWRIQLGAFGDEANAKKLWNALETRISDLQNLQPFLKAGGNITRLQAGPFESRAAANTMCGKLKAAGQDCIAVAK